MYQSQTGFVTGSAAIAQLSAPQALPGVHSALSGVDVAVGELAQCFEALVGRLETAGVLRPVPPQAAQGNQVTPPNFNCSLANAIDAQRNRVRQVIAAIAEIQDRIDL